MASVPRGNSTCFIKREARWHSATGSSCGARTEQPKNATQATGVACLLVEHITDGELGHLAPLVEGERVRLHRRVDGLERRRPAEYLAVVGTGVLDRIPYTIGLEWADAPVCAAEGCVNADSER